MTNRPWLSVGASLAVFACSAFAEATPTLLGQTVRVSYEFPDLGTFYAGPVDTLVDATVELPFFAGFADVDLSDNQIVITARRDAGINIVNFDGFHFFDILSAIPTFVTVSLNPATDYAGLDALRLTFDGDNIFLNLVGLRGLRGQTVIIDVNPSDTAAVPEPSTLVLLGAGLVARARRLRSRAR